MKPWNAAVLSAKLIAISFVAGCVSVPLDTPKDESSAVVSTTTTATTVGKASTDWRKDNPDTNGFYPLIEGKDAFGARLVLMDRAEHTIDAQYFMMKPDDAGLVFSEKLMEAADRGVRVRFLLDDIFTTVSDEALRVMNEHPNLELRIFNPISRKGVDLFNYLGNFSLTNRRMHNKSFTVDNQVSVVGGRNIANEYFQLDTSGEFIDFDMIAAGPIVQDISTAFDDYWNHQLAVPMEVLYTDEDEEKLDEYRQNLDQKMKESGDSVYAEAIHTQLTKDIFSGKTAPYAADARTIIDTPNKLLEKIDENEEKIVADAIREALSNAEKEIIIFTPYFVPGKGGIELVQAIRKKGVRMILVTNSLATNNHTSVHSAYATYRKRMLAAGVELWEARVNAAEKTAKDGTKTLEHLTLHTKGIIIDRRYSFAGSLNLDPRSININTEMGVMVDSEEMAGMLADRAMEKIPQMAYRLELGDDDKITWHATIDGQEVVETKEPMTSGWRRFEAWFLKIAPEKQL